MQTIIILRTNFIYLRHTSALSLRNMKETLASLAQKTGFSASTISRVLTGKSEEYRIKPETRDIILKAAAESNYAPNIIAQNLRTSRTDTIGLLLPSVANPYFADIASIIIKEARKFRYTTMVIDSDENEATEKSSVSTLIARQVDGIIAAPSGTQHELFEEINRKLCPVILIDRYFVDSSLPYVSTNNYLGSMMAIDNLIMNGHTEIACIQGAINSMPNKKRIAGYLSALEKAGIRDKATIVGNEFSEQNGYLETKLLLNRTERPTAIYALSNTIALGAIKAIKETGLNIPADISLISFDDSIYMDYMTPSISRISQPTEEMGKLASKLLFESIQNKTRCTTQLELAPSLISRNSVSLPPRPDVRQEGRHDTEQRQQ